MASGIYIWLLQSMCLYVAFHVHLYMGILSMLEWIIFWTVHMYIRNGINNSQIV